MSARLRVRVAAPREHDALQFFCDTVLRRDYFVRRGQLGEMLGGKRHVVWLAELDRVLVGLAIVTRPGHLVNALVHPCYRGLGLGRALLRATRPKLIRVKTDMHSGDPRPFYRRLGYTQQGPGNARGTIQLFTRTDAATQSVTESPTRVAHGDAQ